MAWAAGMAWGPIGHLASPQEGGLASAARSTLSQNSDEIHFETSAAYFSRSPLERFLFLLSRVSITQLFGGEI